MPLSTIWMNHPQSQKCMTLKMLAATSFQHNIHNIVSRKYRNSKIIAMLSNHFMLTRKLVEQFILSAQTYLWRCAYNELVCWFMWFTYFRGSHMYVYCVTFSKISYFKLNMYIGCKITLKILLNNLPHLRTPV